MKKNLTFLCILLLSIPSMRAHDFEVDGIFYQITSSTENTVGVTSRSENWYQYNNNYSGCVTIPSTITHDGTTYLVSSIMNFAFYGCRNFTSLIISESVTKIEDYAFNGSRWLTTIEVDPNNKNFCSVDGVLYSKGETTLIAYPNGKQKVFSIPESVTRIDNNAFGGCTGLTEVTIPYGVTKIEGSGIKENLVEDITVTTQNGTIVVNGIDSPVAIEVYNLHGQSVYSGNDTTIPVNERGIYLVRVGSQVMKVVL